MGIIESFRGMFAPKVVFVDRSGGGIRVMDMDSAEVYRTQPNLQAVVTFLADNIAQLPLKEYDRVSDGDRKRLTDTTAAKLLARPNADMTQYELLRATSLDYYIYGRCVWLVTKEKSAPSGWEVHPIPIAWIIDYHMRNGFELDSIDVCARNGGMLVNIPAEKLLVFRSYNPTSPAGSVSPIEALKSTLTEQVESDRYRLSVWKNGGKASSYIVRPKDVEKWSPEAADAFKRDFRAAWTGNGPNVGGVPVLEDGMEIKTLQFNAKDSQWAEAKKLSREEVAAVYHVNPSLIWHTDGQTYASAKDNARALYADTLAPMVQMMQQRINAFLLPRLGEPATAYIEFDMKEKLRGSFEEQAQVLQSSVGGPWLTRNEARAMNNLPAIEGGDELIVPLNVLTGGQASPTDSGSQNVGKSAEASVKSAGVRMKSGGDGDKASEVLSEFFKRQSRSVLPKISGGDGWWNEERWDGELADDLEPVIAAEVASSANGFMRQLGAGEFNAEMTRSYVRAMCEGRAHAINAGTERRIQEAIDGGEEPKGVFDSLVERAGGYGDAIAKAAAAFALVESVSQAQERGIATVGATKTWVVTSGNPRASHAAMDGETVPYNSEFSNGARWPGDIQLDPDESCNCRCEVEILIP